MTVKSFVLTGTALIVLVLLGVISVSSPEFKAHATTAVIIVLGIISLTGVLFALIAPLFPERLERPLAESPTEAPEHLRGSEHTGSIR